MSKMKNPVASTHYTGGVGDGGAAAVYKHSDYQRRIARAWLEHVGAGTDNESGKQAGTIPPCAGRCSWGQLRSKNGVPDDYLSYGCHVSHVAHGNRVAPALPYTETTCMGLGNGKSGYM